MRCQVLRNQIPYEDLLTPDTWPIHGVGHIRSPQLKEMWPSHGIGWAGYSLFIYVLRSNVTELSKIVADLNQGENIYEVVTSSDGLCKLYVGALSFFMKEEVLYHKEQKVFMTYEKPNDSKDIKLIGVINSENFDNVRAAILIMNYISPTKANVDVQFSSEKAKAIWEKAQKYLTAQGDKESDPKMAIGNIISKLCVIHPTYNLFNIYDLTVFQLYDQFFQTCYMRSIEFSEAFVSNHGSKEFKFNDWLNPVQNYE